MTSFKIILIGNGGVGKSTFIEQLINKKFEKRYISSKGDIYTIKFNTNKGEIIFNINDCDGQAYFSEKNNIFYQGADAAIIMFDTTNNISHKSVNKWAKDIYNICGNIPVVICGNKIDSNQRIIPKGDYCEISVKNNYNLNEPFSLIARKLMGNNDI